MQSIWLTKLSQNWPAIENPLGNILKTDYLNDFKEFLKLSVVAVSKSVDWKTIFLNVQNEWKREIKKL